MIPGPHGAAPFEPVGEESGSGQPPEVPAVTADREFLFSKFLLGNVAVPLVFGH